MLEDNHIRLRAWESNDLPVLTRIRNDVALQGQLLARTRGSSIEQVRAWLNERSSQPDKLFFIIADQKTDKALGYVQINDLEPIDRRAELGVCLAREAQGRGVGSASIILILTHLRDIFGIEKIFLKVRSDNAKAINCYRKVGFQSCGLLTRHALLDGRFHDVVIMELFLAKIR